MRSRVNVPILYTFVFVLIHVLISLDPMKYMIGAA